MNTDYAYSQFKAVHWRRRLRKLREAGHQPTPVHVHLVMSNRCNQSCRLCAYRLEGYTSAAEFRPQDMLDGDWLLRHLDGMAQAGVKAIQFTGGGEPLTHPRAADVMEHAVGLGLTIALVTNGILMDDRVVDILARGAAWARVSLDASTAGTYSELRRVKSGFDEATGAVLRLSQALEGTDCLLGVGFVAQRGNEDEVYATAELARRLGADNFRISAAFTPEGQAHFDGIWDQIQQGAREAVRDFDEPGRFRVFNNVASRMDDLRDSRWADRCCQKDLVTYLGADRKYYKCCCVAYNKMGLIGDPGDRTFRVFWGDEEKRALFDAHRPIEHCRDAGATCMFREKNIFLEYVTSPVRPPHAEFV